MTDHDYHGGPAWQDPNYHKTAYPPTPPTDEESTEAYIRSHIALCGGMVPGVIPGNAQYHPAESGQPAYLYCPRCMARLTTWCGHIKATTGARVSLYYGLKRCDCAKHGEQDDTIEHNRHSRVTRNLLAHSGLTGRGLNARFDNTRTDRPEIAKAKAKAQQFCRQYFVDRAGDGNGLYLSGGSGTGKTHLACCIAWDSIQHEKSAIYISETDLYRRLFDDHDKSLIGDLQSCYLLILDDVGNQPLRETASNARQEALYQLIDSRYQAMKPTIYTSRYTLDNLAGRGWDASLLDRMAQTSHRISTGYGESFRIDLMPTT